jgi:hypothetical protein
MVIAEGKLFGSKLVSNNAPDTLGELDVSETLDDATHRDFLAGADARLLSSHFTSDFSNSRRASSTSLLVPTE